MECQGEQRRGTGPRVVRSQEEDWQIRCGHPSDFRDKQSGGGPQRDTVYSSVLSGTDGTLL